MLFFTIEAKSEITLDTEAEKNKKQIADISDAFLYYNNENKDAYYFISNIEENNVCAGILIYGSEAKSELLNFPWHIANLKVNSVMISESTSTDFGLLLEKAFKNKFVQNKRKATLLNENLELFSFDYSEGILPYADFYTESLVKDNDNVEQYKTMAKNSLWCDSLIQEYDRIFSMQKQNKFWGHPVHYMFSSNNFAERNTQAENIISVLYACGRLNSKRYCSVSVSKISSHPHSLKDLETLYKCYKGSTIILNDICNTKNLTETNIASSSPIDLLISLIKKYANSVLTILFFPLSSIKEKDSFLSRLSELVFLNFYDESVNSECAKSYLVRKCQLDDIKENELLFSQIEADKTYRASELDKIYIKWYGDYLRNAIYPEYSQCNTVKKELAEEDIRGKSYNKLMHMIGLEEAKKVICRAIDYYKAQKAFSELGFDKDRLAMHMVFTGNPGTAKTTIARLFADIMCENNILSSGHLVEVGRADIVGKYVGSTAPLVKTAFKKAKGGVLFIDEAYSLVDDKKGMYGDEAINTIVQEMENNRDDTCVIFAGYPIEMQNFLDRNPGLRSRIAFHIHFDDYSVDELIEITKLMGEERGIIFTNDAIKKLSEIYSTESKSTDFGNGRFVRNILDKARMSQAVRLINSGGDNVTSETVRTIIAEDIEYLKSKQQQYIIGFGN